jgi:hypothetical protein
MSEDLKKEIASEVAKQVLDSIKNEVIPAVEASIQKTVNGKIDRLTVKVDNLHSRLDEQDVSMAPAIETLQTIKSGRNFIVWAAPLVAAVGAMIAFFKTH